MFGGRKENELGRKLMKKAKKESMKRIRKRHDSTRPNARDLKQRNSYLRYLEK